MHSVLIIMYRYALTVFADVATAAPPPDETTMTTDFPTNPPRSGELFFNIPSWVRSYLCHLLKYNCAYKLVFSVHQKSSAHSMVLSTLLYNVEHLWFMISVPEGKNI